MIAMQNRPLRQPAGSIVVEFALILPVMFTLLAGIFGLGRALAQYETLTKATRDGARLFSMANKATINSTGVQAAKDRVVAIAQAGGMPGFSSSNVLVTCLDKTTYTDGSCADGTEPGGVRVETTGWSYVFGSTVPLLYTSTGTSTLSMKASTTMRYMQPN